MSQPLAENERNIFRTKPTYEEKASQPYSMETASSFAREAASSSPIQVMKLHDDTSILSSMPSWELHPQESFGLGSLEEGHELDSAFKFSGAEGFKFSGAEGDLGAVASGDGLAQKHMPNSHISQHPQPQPQIESRNQSFDVAHSLWEEAEGYNRMGGGSTRNPPSSYPNPVYHMQKTDDNPPPIQSRNQSFDVGAGHRERVGYPSYRPEEGFKHSQAGAFLPHQTVSGRGGIARCWSSPNPSTYRQGMVGGHHQPGGLMWSYSQDIEDPLPHGPPSSNRVHVDVRPPSNFQLPPEFSPPQSSQLTAKRSRTSTVKIKPFVQPKRSGLAGVFSWTKEDDLRLTEIMKKHKKPARDWEAIAEEFGLGKTAKECHDRWIRYVKPGARKGQWTDHEDAVVMEAVITSSEQPFTRWTDLAQRLPGRIGKQIRDRWVNHLNPKINHLPFTRDDDLLLWEAHEKLGKRWVDIATQFFNSTRSENRIKNRWYSASFKKFISYEIGPDAYAKGNKETIRIEDDKNSKPNKTQAE